MLLVGEPREGQEGHFGVASCQHYSLAGHALERQGDLHALSEELLRHLTRCRPLEYADAAHLEFSFLVTPLSTSTFTSTAVTHSLAVFADQLANDHKGAVSR